MAQRSNLLKKPWTNCDVLAGPSTNFFGCAFWGSCSSGALTIWRQHGCDLDGDKVADTVETNHGTSPTNPDTDGDGLIDRVELAGIPPGELVTWSDGTDVLPY
jgi:hypothetical protein